eukprot:SAG25_NODE_18_length_24130_cov_1260.109608_11_plen_90_part_00
MPAVNHGVLRQHNVLMRAMIQEGTTSEGEVEYTTVGDPAAAAKEASEAGGHRCMQMEEEATEQTSAVRTLAAESACTGNSCTRGGSPHG